jgi:gamma-tubulin complex component 5
MAPPTPITSAQEQLLQSLLPKSITAGKSRKYRDAFHRRIKHHNYARTNQFEVTERLDGLEEKFQILNRDDLSDALRSRHAEILQHESGSRFSPDVLDFLLRLSVDPANIKRSDRLISVKEKPRELPPLRWVDIEKNGPIDHHDPIWQNPEYSDLSSDEDVVAISSTATSPRSVQEWVGKAKEEASEHGDKILGKQSLPESVDLSIYRNLGLGKTNPTVLLEELQATRECLFMLQGLPTNLYSGDSTTYTANIRYGLRNVNQEVFGEILRSFGRIGKRVEFVRGWMSEVQTTQYTRSLRESIKVFVSRFDVGVCEMQRRFLRPSGVAHIGLLPCLEASTRNFKDMEVVWEYLQICETKKVDSIGQLEVLFDLVCSEQAAGKMVEASRLMEIFTPAFKVYLRPLVHWMNYGELHENLEGFFVTCGGEQKDLTSLWEGWFLLDESHHERRASRFLKQFSQTIFTLGKTTLFLRRLDDQQSKVSLEVSSLVSHEKLLKALASGYLIFAEIFAEVFGSAVTPALSHTSALLYQQLDRQCGLWNVLDAFECIYFANQGPITDSIETTLFRRLDKCQTAWSDKFINLDLFENAFAAIPNLDTGRLVIHSSHTSSRGIESRRKSVKILGDLSVNYRIPWQIANIIPQACFASYRRISLLLMQIRRTRYSLEQRTHFHVMNASLDSNLAQQNVSRALYQKLLLFGNVLYNHLTALVIDSSTLLMKARMRQASSVDEMTRVHTLYISDLEKACLTTKRLTPIRDAIVSILDLGIRFADIVTTPPGGTPAVDDDADARSFRSAASRPRMRRRREDEDAEDEDEDEDEEGDGG